MPRKTYDTVFEMDLIKFYKKAVFTQRIKVADISKPIVGYYEFMTCDATKCLPPDMVDFSFQLETKMSNNAGDPKEEQQEDPQPKKQDQLQDDSSLDASANGNNGAEGNNQEGSENQSQFEISNSLEDDQQSGIYRTSHLGSRH